MYRNDRASHKHTTGEGGKEDSPRLTRHPVEKALPWLSCRELAVINVGAFFSSVLSAVGGGKDDKDPNNSSWSPKKKIENYVTRSLESGTLQCEKSKLENKGQMWPFFRGLVTSPILADRIRYRTWSKDLGGHWRSWFRCTNREIESLQMLSAFVDQIVLNNQGMEWKLETEMTIRPAVLSSLPWDAQIRWNMSFYSRFDNGFFKKDYLTRLICGEYLKEGGIGERLE